MGCAVTHIRPNHQVFDNLTRVDPPPGRHPLFTNAKGKLSDVRPTRGGAGAVVVIHPEAMSNFTRILTLAVAASSIALGANAAPASSPSRLAAGGGDSRYSAIVVEASTGEVLYARRADSPRYPASISKIMTLYLVFEEMAAGRLNANDMITVSPRAASMPPTKLGLHPGDQISLDNAIRAIALRSANDMAVAVAERVGGSESRFAALMTLRAQELGMSNTHFVNASGLPDSRQVSTARDIAILSRAVMRDFPQYYSYFSQRAFTYRGETITNHNHLLDRMPEVDGLKTGFITASGYNLAASGVRYGHRVIAIELGGASGASRDNNVAGLLTTGFDILHRRDLGETIVATQNLFELPNSSMTAYASNAPAYRDDDEASATSTTSGVSFTSYGHTPSLQMVSPRDAGLRPALPSAQQTALVASASPPPSPIAPPYRPAPPANVASAQQASASRGTASVMASTTWGVQIGAYHNRWDARDQLDTVFGQFERQLRGTHAVIAAYTDGYFRARFVGMDQAGAQSACQAMQAQRISCMVVAPE
jgi:D-alanyl-D-alanine carboxypeptidase